MEFRTTVVLGGKTATGLQVPDDVVDALGAGKRPPVVVTVGRQRAFVRKWPALTEVTVPGSHFVPEDSPHEIGRALAEWIPTLR